MDNEKHKYMRLHLVEIEKVNKLGCSVGSAAAGQDYGGQDNCGVGGGVNALQGCGPGTVVNAVARCANGQADANPYLRIDGGQDQCVVGTVLSATGNTCFVGNNPV